jgi:hypothetical protein
VQHTVYLTTNPISNKFYIGKHSRLKPDGYKGSGVWVNNCKKSNIQLDCKVIAVCQTEKDAYNFERTMVQAAKQQYPDFCMNLLDGGIGFLVGQNKGKPSGMLGKKHKLETIEKLKQNGKKRAGEKHHMYGKTHKLESRKKMSETHILHGHLRGKKVLCVEENVIYNSLAEAARNVSKDSNGRNNIRKSCNGFAGKIYGYTWKFI